MAGAKGARATIRETQMLIGDPGRLSRKEPIHSSESAEEKTGGALSEGRYAYPVIANGRLYIRNLETLWAYDIKANIR
jgi:hypothetical protein